MNTALWTSEGSGWSLLSPSGFPDEATLHGLVEAAPQLLPLAGSPEIVVLGREVQLGGGYADLVAVESSGRIVIIEVKLARNAEARRAIVSQTLSYAAYMHGMTLGQFEQLMGSHLQARGFGGLAAAAASVVQGRPFDEPSFLESVAGSLATGAFRLIFVLDQAPPELVQLTAYLEAIAPELAIDLTTVSSYDVNATQVIVPQRAEAERQVPFPQEHSRSLAKKAQRESGFESPGWEVFEAAIQETDGENRRLLTTMLVWAKSLDAEGLIRLSSYQRDRLTTLLPRLKDADVGILTVYKDANSAYVSLYRSVLEKRAPQALHELESLLSPTPIKQGSTIPRLDEGILAALRNAYVEAAAPADLVVVAAGHAYREYKTHNAYLCQQGRSFREGLKRMAFYAEKEIKEELPSILARRDSVSMTLGEASSLRATGNPEDIAFAEAVEANCQHRSVARGDAPTNFLAFITK